MSLDWRCILCGQPKGRKCVNTIDPRKPLAGGRDEHYARALPPDGKASK